MRPPELPRDLEQVIAFVVPALDARVGVFCVSAARSVAGDATGDSFIRIEQPGDDDDLPDVGASVLRRAVLPIPGPRRFNPLLTPRRSGRGRHCRVHEVPPLSSNRCFGTTAADVK